MSEVVPTHGKIDPEVECQRLAKLYVTMNDLELAEVAGEPTARSEWAFEALRDEMTKRGLDWAGGSAALATLREAASVKTDESGSVPEVLRVYRDMADALTDRMVAPANGTRWHCTRTRASKTGTQKK